MTLGDVESAFHAIIGAGITDEDWLRWTTHLTEDVHYVERHYGTMHGRAQVQAWITELMAVRGDVHGVLNWYIVKGDRVVFDMTNRLYHPLNGQPHFDFAGLTVLEYAGDGLFGYEEDYWDKPGSEVAFTGWLQACQAYGGKGLGNGRLEILERERKAHNHAVLARGG